MPVASTPYPVIANRQARCLLLALQGLSEDPTQRLDDTGLLKLIERLGFVQVDSINTVERAHHHILFSRNQTYHQMQLAGMIEREAALFENWTHDAAIIPSHFYPYWHHRFARDRERLADRWRKWGRAGFERYLAQVVQRIRREGPLMARDFGADGKKGGDGWWDWHPEKTALEYLWRTGKLAVARREGFQKVYDLPERVIPKEYRENRLPRGAFVDWKCRTALARLGFATPGEIAAFWGALTPAEAKAWCARKAGRELTPVLIEPAAGARPRPALAPIDLLDRLAELPEPPSRIRALSPFDPLVRDRARLDRLFGFRYRIEVFVPAAKREYGYYVFPLLEGDRFIGRVDMKVERGNGSVLRVQKLWLEPGIAMSGRRREKFGAELRRLCRFARAERVAFAKGVRL